MVFGFLGFFCFFFGVSVLGFRAEGFRVLVFMGLGF